VLWTLAQSADGSIHKLTKELATWLDRSLTVLGDSYKKWLQFMSFMLGLAMAVGFNVDTIGVAQRLYADKEVREAVATAAVQFTDKTSRETFEHCQQLDADARKNDAACAPIRGLVDAFAKREDTFGKLPIGWGVPSPASPKGWLFRIVGWLLTALAVSIGAPFWFDLLNRFVNVRSGIRRPAAQSEPAA
jgi:hypothetical protein